VAQQCCGRIRKSGTYSWVTYSTYFYRTAKSEISVILSFLAWSLYIVNISNLWPHGSLLAPGEGRIWSAEATIWGQPKVSWLWKRWGKRDEGVIFSNARMLHSAQCRFWSFGISRMLSFFGQVPNWGTPHNTTSSYCIGSKVCGLHRWLTYYSEIQHPLK
jgi:hypothetical protein